jgi:stage V sporulation protein G
MIGGLNKMSNIKLDIRVYPIENPQGSTLAFANIGIEDLVAINGVRVVDSANKGTFVAMPQSKDKDGNYHDIAFPINSDLRKEMSKAVLDKYRETVAEKNQSLGSQLRDGAEQAQRNNSERAEQSRQAVSKKQPGLWD